MAMRKGAMDRSQSAWESRRSSPSARARSMETHCASFPGSSSTRREALPAPKNPSPSPRAPASGDRLLEEESSTPGTPPGLSAPRPSTPRPSVIVSGDSRATTGRACWPIASGMAPYRFTCGPRRRCGRPTIARAASPRLTSRRARGGLPCALASPSTWGSQPSSSSKVVCP